jgi:hypothetical protein
MNIGREFFCRIHLFWFVDDFDQGIPRQSRNQSTPWGAVTPFPGPRPVYQGLPTPVNRKGEQTLGLSSAVSFSTLDFKDSLFLTPEYPIGVVGTVVPLTILGVVLFLYTRHRRQKTQQQPQLMGMPSPDDDPYKNRPVSYGIPPMGNVPLAPYVSFI